MGTLIRNLLLAVFLIGLTAVVEPYLDLAIYTARLARLPPPAQLRIPVDQVSGNALRDSWHAAREPGRRHEGIDIFAPRNTPVRTTTEGVVAHIGTSQLGGRVIWIVGPAGQRHYYTHLERFADVSRGQRVQPGDLIGYVGNTGNASGTPPHLHYGVYTATGAINPFPLLQPRGNARPAPPR